MALEPYMQMLGGAGMDPAQQEQMKKMMLAQFLMGGGAAMTAAGGRGGGPGSFGRSLAAGMMGGLQSGGGAFDDALRYQMYSNQQGRADKRDETMRTRYESDREFREREMEQRYKMHQERMGAGAATRSADEEYKDWYKNYMERKLMADPFYIQAMGGSGTDEPDMPVEPVPAATISEGVEQKAVRDRQAAVAKSMKQEFDSAKLYWNRNQHKVFRPETMSPEELQEAMGKLDVVYRNTTSSRERNRLEIAYKRIRDRLMSQNWDANRGTVNR